MLLNNKLCLGRRGLRRDRLPDTAFQVSAHLVDLGQELRPLQLQLDDFRFVLLATQRILGSRVNKSGVRFLGLFQLVGEAVTVLVCPRQFCLDPVDFLFICLFG